MRTSDWILVRGESPACPLGRGRGRARRASAWRSGWTCGARPWAEPGTPPPQHSSSSPALTYPHSIISLIMALMVGTAVSRKMDDLPMWLQYYPKILFDTINRSGTGVITKAATHSPHCLNSYMLELLNICHVVRGNVCGGGRTSSSCSTPPS